MRQCPVCEQKNAYKLSDGRFKCRACGFRYSWTSVWDSSRLSEANKRQLVKFFAIGVPVYWQRFRNDTSRSSKERFYRLMRACCAHEEQLFKTFTEVVDCDKIAFGGQRKDKYGWKKVHKVVVFSLIQCNGAVKVAPIDEYYSNWVIKQIQKHTSPGSLYYSGKRQAYAALPVRGGYILIRKKKSKPKEYDQINHIEEFWAYAKNQLASYRGVPNKFLHLYLGEICYRFNHRNEDLEPIITKKLKATSIQEMRPALIHES
jgi:transposase